MLFSVFFNFFFWFFLGYGLTETCAGTALQAANQYYSTGNNGPIAACVEVKLLSVPEMNYNVTDKPCPRGEVLIRGPSVTQGYYKDVKQNAESFKDGWFCTGGNKLFHIFFH